MYRSRPCAVMPTNEFWNCSISLYDDILETSEPANVYEIKKYYDSDIWLIALKFIEYSLA